MNPVISFKDFCIVIRKLPTFLLSRIDSKYFVWNAEIANTYLAVFSLKPWAIAYLSKWHLEQTFLLNSYYDILLLR